MRVANLPNFFIVGTGKAGTTSLYHYLQQHPQIYMSPVKEPCHFASEIYPENLAQSHVRHIRRMSHRNSEGSLELEAIKPFAWLVKERSEYLRLFGTSRARPPLEKQVSPTSGRRLKLRTLHQQYPTQE